MKIEVYVVCISCRPVPPTIAMTPSMASQRFRLEVGFQSKSSHEYGVNCLRIRDNFPLKRTLILEITTVRHVIIHVVFADNDITPCHNQGGHMQCVQVSVLGEREQVSRVTTGAWKPEKNSPQ